MIKTKQPILEGERIILRKYKLSDASADVKIWNDKDVIKWLTDADYPYTKKQSKWWIRRTSKRKDFYPFAVILKKNKKLIGTVWLRDIIEAYDYKLAGIGYLFGKQYWGKGYAKEAVKLLINFGFKNLKLKKIYAHVNEKHITSQRVLNKLGFKLEGRLRKQAKMKFNRKWYDELYYGLLKTEWKK